MQREDDGPREQYQAMRAQLRPGDVVYFDALDRLGRNYSEILSEWRWLTEVGPCDVVCLNPSFMSTIEFRKMGDLGKPMEDIALNLMGYIAQHEREEMLRRQKAGIAIAKAKGKYLGKPRKHCDPRRFGNTSGSSIRKLSHQRCREAPRNEPIHIHPEKKRAARKSERKGLSRGPRDR
jgi:DNA invertase Pin-like site-specific DNA recombinase